MSVITWVRGWEVAEWVVQEEEEEVVVGVLLGHMRRKHSVAVREKSLAVGPDLDLGLFAP